MAGARRAAGRQRDILIYVEGMLTRLTGYVFEPPGEENLLRRRNIQMN